MLKNLSRYNQKFINNFNISHAIKQSFGCLPPYIFYILPNDKKSQSINDKNKKTSFNNKVNYLPNVIF